MVSPDFLLIAGSIIIIIIIISIIIIIIIIIILLSAQFTYQIQHQNATIFSAIFTLLKVNTHNSFLTNQKKQQNAVTLMLFLINAPLKFNMEPDNDGFTKGISFSRGCFSGSMLNFRGVRFYNPEKIRRSYYELGLVPKFPMFFLVQKRKVQN